MSITKFAPLIVCVLTVSACGWFNNTKSIRPGNGTFLTPIPSPTSEPTKSGSDQGPSDASSPQPEASPPADTAVPTAEPNAPTSEPQTDPTAMPTEIPSPEPSASAGLVYADVQGIIKAACEECHKPGGEREKTPLTNFEEVKKARKGVTRKIQRCTMPPDDDVFCRSEDAKKLLEWLNTGSDLPPL